MSVPNMTEPPVFSFSFRENQSICNGKNSYQISHVARRDELQGNCRIMQSEEGLTSMIIQCLLETERRGFQVSSLFPVLSLLVGLPTGRH